MTNVEIEADNLPVAMIEARRWLLWKSIPNPDPSKKPRKVPFYANGRPRHGALDSDADAANLATFSEAVNACTRDFAGLGFALGPDGTGNCWQGVDFDNLASRPELALLADDGLPGYTESSPSGDGLHAIGYGRAFQPLGSNSTGIEAYSGGRFFTVTGEGSGLGELTDLADYVDRVLRPRHSAAASPSASAQVLEYVDPRTLSELRSALASMRADDRSLWVANGQRLKKLGERGRALWLEWSQQSEKFDPADAAHKWDSFTADHTGYQAVFADAQRHGWVNPMAGHAPPAPAAPESLSTAITSALTPLTPADLAAAKETHPHAFMSTDGTAGLFPEGEVTVIGAPGREGKTTVVTAIATHYVLGLPIGGMAPLEIRSAVIYSGEDDRTQYARKAGAQWERLSTTDRPRLLDNLLIPDLHSEALAAWREIVRLEGRTPVRGPVVAVLIEAINALRSRDCPPGLVIFETASTLSDAEEDNPGHKVMIAALKHVAKMTGCAVVLVHHTSQAAANNLPDLNISEADIRGGTTLVNNARQTHLIVNLGSELDPFSDSDARTLLRHMVAPGEKARITAMVCLSSSKSADPTPLFFRWEDSRQYGPRAVEVIPPENVRGKSWRATRRAISGARVEAKADRKAEQAQANVRLVVRAAAEIASKPSEYPTVAKISAACGHSPTWAKPYVEMAVELGELVRFTEQVPRTRGMTDVFRPPADATRPWDSTNDSTQDSTAPWSH